MALLDDATRAATVVPLDETELVEMTKRSSASLFAKTRTSLCS